jgi:hypothetical protein
VVVVEVVLSVKAAQWTFLGVTYAVGDSQRWDWPDSDGLLWAFDDGQHLRLCQTWLQHPRFLPAENGCAIEAVIGHHEGDNGNLYMAVKWIDYECPTWELESDLANSGQLTNYWASYNHSIKLA